MAGRDGISLSGGSNQVAFGDKIAALDGLPRAAAETAGCRRTRLAGAQGGSVLTTTQTRQSQRTPVTLKIKFKSATLGQFIERYAIDVSQGGIFIRTKDPLPVGTTMRFEFQLRDASPLITGEGTVVWIREHSPNQAGVAPGMGVRFDRLTESSQGVLHEILAQKAGKGSSDDDDEPFAEQPTRVAPSPLVDDLAKESKERPSQNLGAAVRRVMLGQQPASTGVPFQSDADEFSEEAFEQSTRVHSLDELAAASASIGSMEIEQIAAASTAASDSGESSGEPKDQGEDQSEDQRESQSDAQPSSQLDDEPKDQSEGQSEGQSDSEPQDSIDSEPQDSIDSESEDLVPSQADDRAQTSIFPSKRRLRPMFGLGAALGRAGRGDGADRAARADDAAGAAPADEPKRPGVLDGDADVTHELPVRDLVDEPTRESILALEPVHPADEAAEPADQPGDDQPRQAAKQQGEQPGAAADSTPSKAEAEAAAEAEARPATAQAELDDTPAKRRVTDDGVEDEDDDNLTHLMQKPRVQGARSGVLATMAIGVLLLGVLGAGGYYFMFMRGGEQPGEAAQVEAPAAEQADQAAATEAVPPAADEVPEEVEEPAPIEEPAPPPIELATVEVRTTPKGATAELVDGAQEGPTPMTFELDESKSHRIRISHPGYITQELTVDPAGPAPERVTLETAPWLFRLTSTPADAVVYINGRRVPGSTPTEMELPPGWEKKRQFKVSFRLVGYEKLDIMVDNAFQAESDAMVQSVAGTLVERAEPVQSAAAEDQGGSSPAQGKDQGQDEDGRETQEAQKAPEKTQESSSAAEEQAGDQSPAQTPDENAAPADQAPKPPAAQQPAPSDDGAADGAGDALEP